MKRKILYTALLAVASVFAGCSEPEMPLYDDQTRYLHFTESSDEEIRFSFKTLQDQSLDEYVVEIPVTLIGTAPSQDLEYKVSVVSSETTATEACYQIPTQVFPKGQYEGVVRLVLKKNEAELVEEKKIVLTIATNDNFMMGPVDHITATVYTTNVLSEPSWWGGLESAFFGEYSELKYQEFITATGVADLTGMGVAEVTAYMREFIYHLRRLDEAGTPAYMEDGKTKILDSINFTNA